MEQELEALGEEQLALEGLGLGNTFPNNDGWEPFDLPDNYDPFFDTLN